MGRESNIQWCDSTVNPTTGCDGCELATPGRPDEATCYAKSYHERRMANALPVLYAGDFHEVRLAPGRMAKAAAWPDLTGTKRPDKPWLNGMPRVIFVGDLGDVLSRDVPFEYLKAEVIDVATSPAGRRHILMVLTKQARRLAEFSAWLADRGVPWPSNVWPGVSVTRQANVARVRCLLDVGDDRTVRFISAEPLLSPVGIPFGGIYCRFHRRMEEPCMDESRPCFRWQATVGDMLSLCIIGGESAQGGHDARPFDVAWARELVRLCKRFGVSPFVKQLGGNVRDRNDAGFEGGPDDLWNLPHALVDVEHDANGYREGYQGAPVRIRLADRHGGDWSQWPVDLRVREFPRMAAVEVAPC